jgi:integrase
MAVRRITLRTGEVRYEAYFEEAGRERRRRFRTRKDAEAAVQEARDRQRRRKAGIAEQREPITYAELADLFLDQYTASGRRTDRWMRDMLAYSLTTFGPVSVRELLPENIGRWVKQLPVSAKTKQHALASMRQVLNAGVTWDYLRVNPARPAAVKSPPSRTPEITPFESWDEVFAVAREARRYAPLIIFACATGLRPEEWSALQWRDLDRRTRRCAIRRTYAHGEVRSEGKREASLRTVLLADLARNALDELPEPLRSTQLVFAAKNGGHINLSNWRRRVWYPALARAELERRPLYQMRHTFATLALAAGMPIDFVSRQLGHTDIRTTLRFYARYIPALEERHLAMLNDGWKTAAAAGVDQERV